jgi:dsDNA-specific endonuclease/ATPase MutS2
MFKIGDKVSFLDEVGEGIITGFPDKKHAMVELNNGLSIPFLLTQLVAVKTIIKKAVIDKPEKKEALKGVKRIVIEKEVAIPQKKSQKNKNTRSYVEEVDLHIEELSDNYNKMTNGQIMEIQLNHFRRKLEQAIQNGNHKIVFIHGVGNGVLKSEIRKLLNSYSGISYHDASFRKYGFGATEVEIY